MGCFSPTSSTSVSSCNSCRSVYFTRHSTSSSVSTDIPSKPCSSRCSKPEEEALYLSFCQPFCTTELALIWWISSSSHILFNLSRISVTTSSFSEDKLSRQILVDFLGKASASGMCLIDSPFHFQGLSVGCLRGWRQRNWRCFLSYIYWSKFCSIISPSPVANTFTR